MCLNASFESEEHGRQSLPAQDLIGTGKTQNITAINKNECFDHWRQFVCKKNYGTIKQTYFSWEITWNDFCICYCFRCCVMNFFGCIKEIMDNSFFYGMMEENTSKNGVYCWFPACRPIPAFHPIRSADRKDVGAGSPFG